MNILAPLISATLAVTITLLSGCATQPSDSVVQVITDHPQIQSLDSALKQARAEGAEVLAPQSYNQLVDLHNQSLVAAQKGNSQKAQSTATVGLNRLDNLKNNINNSRELLKDVLQARNRAYQAGALILERQALIDIDSDLQKAATLIEKGNVEKAKQLRPKLLDRYNQLELNALKQGTVEQAKSMIANAEQQGAEKLAPRTFARAQEQMQLATTVLDADRTQTAKAEIYATNAKWLAEKSAAISETVKDFERRNYSNEDIILWHQQQLEVINEPLAITIPFNQASEQAALSLRNAIIAEQQINSKLTQDVEQRQQELLVHQDKLKKEGEHQQRFDLVQAMFSADEAQVSRQGQNVLISAFGFEFPPGQSEIQTKNFPLMNKIIQAIKIFPNASIDVIGHTDSTGDAAINQMLSNDRAEKVAKFLVEIGGFKQYKVSSQGFGETRPVASNETLAGRAENRRVEINIKNQ